MKLRKESLTEESEEDIDENSLNRKGCIDSQIAGASLELIRPVAVALRCGASEAQLWLGDFHLRLVDGACEQEVVVPLFHTLLYVNIPQSLAYVLRAADAVFEAFLAPSKPRMQVRFGRSYLLLFQMTAHVRNGAEKVVLQRPVCARELCLGDDPRRLLPGLQCCAGIGLSQICRWLLNLVCGGLSLRSLSFFSKVLRVRNLLTKNRLSVIRDLRVDDVATRVSGLRLFITDRDNLTAESGLFLLE